MVCRTIVAGFSQRPNELTFHDSALFFSQSSDPPPSCRSSSRNNNNLIHHLTSFDRPVTSIVFFLLYSNGICRCFHFTSLHFCTITHSFITSLLHCCGAEDCHRRCDGGSSILATTAELPAAPCDHRVILICPLFPPRAQAAKHERCDGRLQRARGPE